MSEANGVPEWVSRLWPDKPPRKPYVPSSPQADGNAEAYAAAALRRELADLAETEEGGRNDQLNLAAFNLAQLVAGGSLTRDVTWSALYETAVGIGLTERETLNTLRSAFGAGETLPRAVPPAEGHGGDVTVLDGLAQAQPLQAVGDSPEGLNGQSRTLRDEFPTLDWSALWSDEQDTTEWVLRPLLPAGRLVAVFSPPKVGKSLLMLEVAVAVSQGTEVLGEKPDRPRRVLYVDFENDPRGDVKARLQAMGHGPDDLHGLAYLSFPTLPHLDTLMGGAVLLQLCEEYAAEVVVIDTISRAVAGEENSNDTWLAFYKHTGVRLKGSGITCVRLDHTGKDLSRGMRGGSAKYGDVDLVWSLTAPGPERLVLECVAQRLPVPERFLTLTRTAAPLLRHDVDTGGRLAARDAERDEALAWLDSMVGADTRLSVNAAVDLLKANGRGRHKNTVSAWLKVRDLRWDASHDLLGGEA